MAKKQNKIQKKTGLFFNKLEQLKEVHKARQNLYSDSVCRLIRQINREHYANEKPDSNFIAKCKTIEYSFVSTEQSCKKYAEKVNEQKNCQSLIEQISLLSERKSIKKLNIIYDLNLVRWIIKQVQISNKMSNFQNNYDKQG